MKQVLIITSGKDKQGSNSTDRLRYVEEFCRAVEDKLDKVKVNFTTYHDLEISVLSGESSFYDSRNQLDLSTVDVIHFKNWVNDTQIAGMVARFASRYKIRVYNSEVAISPSRTKIAQMVLFADNGLPVPDTFFAKSNRLKDAINSSDNLPQSFKFPLILKANDGSKGDDNYLIQDKDQALEIMDKAEDSQEFVLQAYQPNDGDYRLLYVGIDEPPLVFLRKPVSASSHLNNTSKGGSGQIVSLASLPPDFLRIARHAAELTGREIGGVDILVNKQTNLPLLLEVNQTPALATGFAPSEKIKRFVNLIDNALEANEEE